MVAPQRVVRKLTIRIGEPCRFAYCVHVTLCTSDCSGGKLVHRQRRTVHVRGAVEPSMGMQGECGDDCSFCLHRWATRRAVAHDAPVAISDSSGGWKPEWRHWWKGPGRGAAGAAVAAREAVAAHMNTTRDDHARRKQTGMRRTLLPSALV